MQTLSNGVKKPQTGDKGSVFFPALESNFQIQNDHIHEGTDSERLSSKAMTTYSETVAAAASGGWSHQGSGVYRKTISMPSPFQWDTCIVEFRIDDSSKERLFLKATKVTATSFYVYANLNTLDLVILYSV